MDQSSSVSPADAAKLFIPKTKKASVLYRFFKRLWDIVLSLAALIALSPLVLLLSLINAIVCKGNPFYADKRVGRNGKTISLFKFQSMYPDAEEHPEKYLTSAQLEEWKSERKVENDPRVLPFGRFLRKTSMDEIPQFVNILVGTLSLVGPRAITDVELARYYSDEQKKILLSCRPGLTGYWQVKARNEASYESGKRTIMEMTYFEKRGFFYDFYLVLATLPAMIKHKGL
jgi:lipopolysaccharide/colanic/teichoic acid biosynthesis glycosyltransferase